MLPAPQQLQPSLVLRLKARVPPGAPSATGDRFAAGATAFLRELSGSEPVEGLRLKRKWMDYGTGRLAADLLVPPALGAAVEARTGTDGLVLLPPPWGDHAAVEWPGRPRTTHVRVVNVPDQLGTAQVQQLLQDAGCTVEACRPALDEQFGLPRASAVDVVLAASNAAVPATITVREIPGCRMRLDILPSRAPLCVGPTAHAPSAMRAPGPPAPPLNPAPAAAPAWPAARAQTPGRAAAAPGPLPACAPAKPRAPRAPRMPRARGRVPAAAQDPALPAPGAPTVADSPPAAAGEAAPPAPPALTAALTGAPAPALATPCAPLVADGAPEHIGASAAPRAPPAARVPLAARPVAGPALPAPESAPAPTQAAPAPSPRRTRAYARARGFGLPSP
jgi:hypothetical protein